MADLSTPRIFIDIETIGVHDTDREPGTEQAEGTERDGLHLAKCRVVAIGLAVDDAEVECWRADHVWARMREQGYTPADVWLDTELDMLAWISDHLWAHKIGTDQPGVTVGYNVRSFDIPRLNLIAVLHGHGLARWFPMPGPGIKPWDLDGRVHDIMHLIGSGYGNACKQSDLAERFGLNESNPGPGSLVAQWHVEGRHDLIADHVCADVRELRELYRRIYGWRNVNNKGHSNE